MAGGTKMSAAEVVGKLPSTANRTACCGYWPRTTSCGRCVVVEEEEEEEEEDGADEGGVTSPRRCTCKWLTLDVGGRRRLRCTARRHEPRQVMESCGE